MKVKITLMIVDVDVDAVVENVTIARSVVEEGNGLSGLFIFSYVLLLCLEDYVIHNKNIKIIM